MAAREVVVAHVKYQEFVALLGVLQQRFHLDGLQEFDRLCHFHRFGDRC
jgi:hypothetical protein